MGKHACGIFMILKSGMKFWKQNTDQNIEETEPLIGKESAVPTYDVMVETTQSIQDVFRSMAWPEDPDFLERGPCADPAAIQGAISPFLESAMSESFTLLGMGSVQDGWYNLKARLSQVEGLLQEELQRRLPGFEGPHLSGIVSRTALRCLFSWLQLAVEQSHKADHMFLLLYNVHKVYLSKECLAYQPILSDWVQNAERKLLVILKEEVSELLMRILQDDETDPSPCIPENEEGLIKLHIDVIQLLEGFIRRAESVSQALMSKVQEVCHQELLVFIHKYVERETERGAKLSPSRRMQQILTFNTCRELGDYVQRIAGDRVGDSAMTISLLEDMKTRALELVLDQSLHTAETSLKKYFRKGDTQMEDIMEEVRRNFENLPLRGQKTHMIVVDSAYQRLTSLYLSCLLLSNRGQLEKRWDGVGRIVTLDANCLHRSLSQLNHGVSQRNMVLLKVEEVLRLRDLDALKLASCELLTNGSSLEQLRDLLHWRGDLSRSQVREVLACLGPALLNPGPPSRRRWFTCCCCCC